MRIALCGLGRAGTQVVRSLYGREGVELSAIFCRDGSPRAGKTIRDYFPNSSLDCEIHALENAEHSLRASASEVLIDFSSRKATLTLLPVCASLGVRMVVCTTGFTKQELAAMRQTAESSPGFALVYAPNVTLGVNVMMRLAQQTARLLPDYDYAITEKHHRRKADVSATARRMAEGLEDTLHKPVALNSIRAGGYVGLHELLIANEFERITIIHESFSRQAFANGALAAAAFVMGREGYYSMEDVVREHFEGARADTGAGNKA
ncbi:MAG: 4-hydroxy-tetrahydrodipicolinate reductase [Clostridia bacterium]|nr:4-hydroxy-tetrahydrodipicolinate reductase [Clostridia bacterium]